MVPPIEEKQISIRLDERYVSRLDALAKNGALNRNQLMLSLVTLWLNVLDTTGPAHFFYIANLLRVREVQIKGGFAYEHEFTELKIPEKPLPIKISEEDRFRISCFANHNHISNHLLLKTMIIVSIEELEEITQKQTYNLAEVEDKLYKTFQSIMKKGFKAFQAYMGKKILL